MFDNSAMTRSNNQFGSNPQENLVSNNSNASGMPRGSSSAIFGSPNGMFGQTCCPNPFNNPNPFSNPPNQFGNHPSPFGNQSNPFGNPNNPFLSACNCQSCIHQRGASYLCRSNSNPFNNLPNPFGNPFNNPMYGCSWGMMTIPTSTYHSLM